MSLTQSQFNSEHGQLLEEKHNATLQNIKNLQDLEKYMFQNLEKVSNQDSTNIQEQQQIIAKINEVSGIRSNLFNQLKNVYASTQMELTNERKDLAEQIMVVRVVENELNQAKENLTALTNDRDNKLRLVEIGNYESSRYEAHIGIMKIVSIASVIVLLISIGLQKGYIPSNIASGLILTSVVVSVLLILNRIRDILSRSNTDFDEYNFYYDRAQTQPGYETVIEHDKAFFHKLGGEARSEFNASKDKLNNTLNGLAKTADSMGSMGSMGSMIDVNKQIGALTTESFKVQERVSGTVHSENSKNKKMMTPVETEGYDNFAKY